MVNISEALIKWLSKYVESDIATDSLGEDSVSIGLFKTPQQTKVEDILGNVTFDDFYTFMVRLDNITNSNLINNQVYMQNLTDWIEEQNLIKSYPDVSEYECLLVEVSTPFYMGASEEHSSIYQITIHIQYRKEIH